MTVYKINLERCSGCGLCVEACPEQAIQLLGERAFILPDRCNQCGICVSICKRGAIQVVDRVLTTAPANSDFSVDRQIRRRGRHQHWRGGGARGWNRRAGTLRKESV